MTPVSHGYQVLDQDRSFRGSGFSNASEADSVVVQREQMEDLELWFFGVFDDHGSDGVTKYLQTHLFNRKLNEVTLVYVNCFFLKFSHFLS